MLDLHTALQIAGLFMLFITAVLVYVFCCYLRV